MVGERVTADSDGLRQMASQLRASTSGIEEAAKSVPDMPEVTTSSDKVGHTISEIMKTTAAVVAGVEDIANKIDANDGSYAQTDNQNADDLGKLPKSAP